MKFKRFLKNSNGNMAIMFSLVAVPVILAGGAATDLLRANNANTLLQAATDAAALAGVAGKNNRMNEGNITKAVKSYLESNGANKILKNVTVSSSGLDKNGIFHVKLTGKIETTFMALAGYPTMDVMGYSEVEVGSGGLEIALVLDTTDSMNFQGRLPALKIAAKDLVEKVLKDKAPSSYIKIGIVPFANYVNVGVGNKSQSWVKIPPMLKTWQCWDTYPNVTVVSCADVPNAPIDGVPQAGTHQSCIYNYGAKVQACGWDDPQWNGVVGSRNAGLDTKKQGGGAPYPGLINYSGPQQITEMTDVKSTLDTNIDALTASAETYIPSGLMWGWELLDASEPFLGVKTAKEMTDSKGTKALVLMTDGDNTKSADYPYHGGNDDAAADAKTTELCENVKKDGISVYTVAFKVGKISTKTMLKSCASNPGQAFDATDDAALLAAFGDIAASLAQVRLTK